jgi:hypothetical protein
MAAAILENDVGPLMMRFCNQHVISSLCTKSHQNWSKMNEIQPSRTFQHGGGGHLGKGRRTVDDAFFELSMSLSVCVLNLIKIGR